MDFEAVKQVIIGSRNFQSINGNKWHFTDTANSINGIFLPTIYNTWNVRPDTT